MAARSLEPRNAFICTEMAAVRGLASKGLGVAVIPRSVAEQPGPPIELRPIWAPRPLTWPIALIWRAGRRQTPAGKAFLAGRAGARRADGARRARRGLSAARALDGRDPACPVPLARVAREPRLGDQIGRDLGQRVRRLPQARCTAPRERGADGGESRGRALDGTPVRSASRCTTRRCGRGRRRARRSGSARSRRRRRRSVQHAVDGRARDLGARRPEAEPDEGAAAAAPARRAEALQRRHEDDAGAGGRVASSASSDAAASTPIARASRSPRRRPGRSPRARSSRRPRGRQAVASTPSGGRGGSCPRARAGSRRCRA